MSILIKRYQNRKLYNLNTKRYIALSAIRELIRDGEDINIIDNKTGKDITGTILTQIIFDYEKKYSGIFPPELLFRIVQSGGSRLENIWEIFTSRKYHHNNFDNEIKRRINILIDKGELSKDLGDVIVDKILMAGERGDFDTDDNNFSHPGNIDKKSTKSEITSLIHQIEKLSVKVDLYKKKLFVK